MGAADRLNRGAQASAAAGRAVSAHSAFLRASNYYRAAATFLLQPGAEARLKDAWRLQREAFLAALANRPGWGEAVSFPYEGGSLRGYVFAAPGAGRKSALILTGGYDSTAEEVFLYSGPAALARGYTIVSYDGPGQGGALAENGLRFRPDWEAVVAAVVAPLVARSDIDPDRIAINGLSFGGYLAPRAASGVAEIAACVADPGQYSLLEEARSRLPGPLARALPDGNPFLLDVIDRLARLRLNHPTRGWALRRGLFVHGVERPIDYFRLTAEYTLEGRAERIRCPTFVASAENDAIGATGAKLFEKLVCPKVFQRFSDAEGAGEHCEAGARGLFNERAFDWLDGVFGVPPARADRAA
jgi:hypothetical protein